MCNTFLIMPISVISQVVLDIKIVNKVRNNNLLASIIIKQDLFTAHALISYAICLDK